MSEPDQHLPSLPSDITFEICTSSSSSSPPPIPPSATTATTTISTSTSTSTSTTVCSSSVTARCGEDNFSEGNGEAFVKSERVSGMHFLTDREEDRADLLLPKSESGEAEPEVRKQVGWSAAFDTDTTAGSAPPIPGFARRTMITRKRPRVWPRPRGNCNNRNGETAKKPLRKLLRPRI